MLCGTKAFLEAGAFCVEVLVLLTIIRGVHTLQCLKIERGPSSVLKTFASGVQQRCHVFLINGDAQIGNLKKSTLV